MYGLEAINAHNGWSMAIVGPLIVMSGLTILAIIISQLHKLVALMEGKDKKDSVAKTEAATENPDQLTIPDRIPDDINEAALIYQPLIDQLEQPFELHGLYEIAAKSQFPHPHLTINRLRDASILQDEGDGLFTWKG